MCEALRQECATWPLSLSRVRPACPGLAAAAFGRMAAQRRLSLEAATRVAAAQAEPLALARGSLPYAMPPHTPHALHTLHDTRHKRHKTRHTPPPRRPPYSRHRPRLAAAAVACLLT